VAVAAGRQLAVLVLKQLVASPAEGAPHVGLGIKCWCICCTSLQWQEALAVAAGRQLAVTGLVTAEAAGSQPPVVWRFGVGALCCTSLCKELQDTQTPKTMQQNAALTLLDGAPATMAKRC
jgi:hypothetical protein